MKELVEINFDESYGLNDNDLLFILKKLHPKIKWKISYSDYEDKGYSSLAVYEEDLEDAQQAIDDIDLRNYAIFLTQSRADKLLGMLSEYKGIFQKFEKTKGENLQELSNIIFKIYDFIPWSAHPTILQEVPDSHWQEQFNNFHMKQISNKNYIELSRQTILIIFQLNAILSVICTSLKVSPIDISSKVVGRYFNRLLLLNVYYGIEHYLNDNFLMKESNDATSSFKIYPPTV